MSEKELQEIKDYWHYSGDSREVSDIVELRENAISDIHSLAYEVKRLQQENERLKDQNEVIKKLYLNKRTELADLSDALKVISNFTKTL